MPNHNVDKAQNARILVRRRLDKLTTDKLPMNPLSLDNLLLTLLDTPELVVATVNQIATSEYGLVINGAGMIDLPSPIQVERQSNISVKFRPPTRQLTRRSDLPPIHRKSTKRDSDGQPIDKET